MKLYTLKDPHGSHVSHVLEVGSEKPLGYVNYTDIENAGITPLQLKEALEERGLKVLELGPEKHSSSIVFDGDEPIKLTQAIPQGEAGALFYAYDEQALSALLASERAQSILQEAGWPAIPKEFIERLHVEHACPKTELFDLISDAFGSYQHAGRTDQNIPDAHPLYEKLRGQKGRDPSEIPLNALTPAHGSDIYEAVLSARPIADDSRAHYMAQVKAAQGELEGDWRDRLEANRRKMREEAAGKSTSPD